MKIARPDPIVGSPPTARTGISCGSTCSAQFPDGTVAVLSSLPANGYVFGNFSVTPPFTCGVTGHNPSQCFIYLADSAGPAASVQATFLPYSAPPLCTVPDVKGKTLAKAEALLTRTHCGVGTVRYAFSRKAQKGRVISQNPHAGWWGHQGDEVNLVVGKGKRKSHHERI